MAITTNGDDLCEPLAGDLWKPLLMEVNHC